MKIKKKTRQRLRRRRIHTPNGGWTQGHVIEHQEVRPGPQQKKKAAKKQMSLKQRNRAQSEARYRSASRDWKRTTKDRSRDPV